MATQVQLRRGTTAQHSTFTGAVGEVSVDTSKNTLVVHNGVTAGGFPVPTPSDVRDGEFVFLGTAGGTANALTAVAPNTISAYTSGQSFEFVAASANTGATTINIDGVGAVAITKQGALPLEQNDINAGAVVRITYDGTQWQLASGVGGGAKAGGVIYENSTTISSNYTLTANKNGFSVGPITIDSGVSVSVGSGQRWVIS
jgi:hypothetical protein